MEGKRPLVDGNDIPVLGLGAFRRDSEEATVEVVRKFISLTAVQSMRHIEISELFGNGSIILNAINDCGVQREDIFLTYKVWPKDRSGADIIESVADSLSLIQLSHFDLVLIHAPIDTKKKFDQWSALEVLKDQGLTKSIGVSCYSEMQLVELMKFCQIQPSVLQFEVTPFGTTHTLTEYCSDSSIVVLCNNVQAKGMKMNHPEVTSLASTYNTCELAIFLQWSMLRGFAVVLSPYDFMNLDRISIDGIDISSLGVLDNLDEGTKTSILANGWSTAGESQSSS